MLEYIAFSALGSLIGGLATYVIVKKTFSDEAILDKIDLITDEIMKNADLQKKIYTIGALVGKGIIDGTGMQKKGGKFSWEQLIMQVAGQWFSGQGQKGKPAPQPQPLITLNP